MKSLKFDHEIARLILSHDKISTWLINDDKDLRVDDEVVIIDKVDPQDKNSWLGLGVATINEIVQKRLGDIDPKLGDGHETYPSKLAMYQTFRQYYGNQIGPKSSLKIIHFSFKPYKHHRRLEDIEDKKTTLITEVNMYADGGSRGNPGPSASGFGILDMDDNIIVKRGIYLGVTTNNQAEYKALKLGLEEAQKLNVETVHVYMDSLLVINQMLGKFKVRNLDLRPIYESIKILLPYFKQVSFTHVPRELNKLADSMVNKALDHEFTL